MISMDGKYPKRVNPNPNSLAGTFKFVRFSDILYKSLRCLEDEGFKA